MRRALEGLPMPAGHALIDGNRIPPGYRARPKPLLSGDGKMASIAAASILAKTHRDALMRELAVEYPYYGFERHMGYRRPHIWQRSTNTARTAHRRSFAPVAQLPLL